MIFFRIGLNAFSRKLAEVQFFTIGKSATSDIIATVFYYSSSDTRVFFFSSRNYTTDSAAEKCLVPRSRIAPLCFTTKGRRRSENFNLKFKRNNEK